MAIGHKITSKERTNISKIGRSLKDYFNIKQRPFIYNNADGYTAKFILVENTRAADNQAKKAAVHTTYNDKKNYNKQEDFERENDAAQDHIDEHQ